MSYSPEFVGPFEGFVVNHIARNMWRVSSHMDRDDVLQEARLVFYTLRRRYVESGEVVDPPHFMALFKTSWLRHFNDLSNTDTARRTNEVPYPQQEGDAGVEWQPLGDRDNDGYLALLIEQAPSEVKSVLNLFLSAPQELLDMALTPWRGKDRRCRAGGSKHICKLLGLDENLDVMRMTEEYFRR